MSAHETHSVRSGFLDKILCAGCKMRAQWSKRVGSREPTSEGAVRDLINHPVRRTQILDRHWWTVRNHHHVPHARVALCNDRTIASYC